jgi:hypothetical protein
MASRKDDISEYLRKLRLIRDALEQLRRIHSDAIASLSWLNQVIDRNLNDISFLLKLFEPLGDSAVDRIPAEEYPNLVSPLQNLVGYGSTYLTVRDQSKSVQDYLAKIIPIASQGSAIFASTTSASAANLFVSFSVSLPTEGERIRALLDRYLQQLRIEDEITYIKQRLPNLTPNVFDDFVHFLSNYYSSEGYALKYQELIGFRSLFFIKLVDGFAFSHGCTNSTPRKDRIMVFSFSHMSGQDQTQDLMADSAMAVWKSLSKQDTAGMSAKMGNVTSEYVRLLFGESIVVAGALLRQNELSWR